MLLLRQYLANRARGSGRGPFPPHDPARALNFSYVLHERSDSPAVRAHVEAAASHARLIARRSPVDWRRLPVIGEPDLANLAPSLILTASLGLPRVLSQLALSSSEQPALLIVDAPAERTGTTHEFFRASARLRLPEMPVTRLAIAALVVRPGGRSLDLVARGPFEWPTDKPEVVAALEDIVRAHATQWTPSVALWDAPAEHALPPSEFQ